MLRWPLPSSETFAVEFVLRSTSPVPQLAAQPRAVVLGALVVGPAGVRRRTLTAEEKASLKVVVQPAGGGGTVVADALCAVASSAAAGASAAISTTAARRVTLPV